ncbi:hypothetical protein SNEBB_007144 [Seison nebaliae]|nr:hypothetical protein SNEBB_007144 [Seison nebaliae]
MTKKYNVLHPMNMFGVNRENWFHRDGSSSPERKLNSPSHSPESASKGSLNLDEHGSKSVRAIRGRKQVCHVSWKEKKEMDYDRTITDMDEIIENWVLAIMQTINSKLAKQDMKIDIDWKKVKIETNEIEYKEHDKLLAPKTHILLRTEFNNKTSETQEYSLKAERTTRQTYTYSFFKGLCRGIETSLMMKLPSEILEVGGALRREQSVEMGREQMKEDEITWAVDSVVRVRCRSTIAAELVVKEYEYAPKFEVQLDISGKVFISIFNRKHHDEPVHFVEGRIFDIFDWAHKRHLLPHHFRLNRPKRLLEVEVTGQATFRFGVDQHVTLKEVNNI